MKDHSDDITKLAKQIVELGSTLAHIDGSENCPECGTGGFEFYSAHKLATAYLELKEKYEQLLSLSGEALNQLENGDYIYRCSGCTPYEPGNADCPGHSALETLKEDLHKFLERKESK